MALNAEAAVTSFARGAVQRAQMTAPDPAAVVVVAALASCGANRDERRNPNGDNASFCTEYGTVIRAGWECATLPKKGFGQRVVLRVGCTNYYMYFGHLSQINVAAGQKLKPGDLIGVEGSTGHSTGSHLHWEIRINDIKTGYVSVYHYAGIPNMPGSASYTSNWAAEIFGPGNLIKPTSGYPQRLYNSALQGALGINQDGVFGANTEKAVKEFQTAHGLTADGIVGTQTKAALSKLF